MIYILIGLAVVFVATGFIVTKKNAKYLLSGYNTMSEEQREQFDIKSYIPLFRKFHVFLGISFLLLGLCITNFISEKAGGIFLAVYPIAAYLYFAWRSSRFSKGINPKLNNLGIIVLIAALAFVLMIFFLGLREDKLVFDSQSIVFTGSYGEELNPSDIQSILLVDVLPEITLRTNGFALGSTRKGYFRTRSGETVKLILNSDNSPYILVIKSDGRRIYFSAKETINTDLLAEIQKAISDINSQ